MSTHELFQKHFGNTAAVDMKHPNMESFFEELNAECLAEDKQKNCNIPPVIRSGRWKCMLCGRDRFTHKSPHKCVGGFRKRKIVWQEVESHCV